MKDIKKLSSEQEAILDSELKKIESLRPFPPGFFKFEEVNRFEITVQELNEFSRAINSIFEREFISHRPYIGPFIVAAKQFGHKLFKRLFLTHFQGQVGINHYTWMTAFYLKSLQDKVKHLEERLKELEAKL